MYIGALKFSHSYFNVYVARVAPLGLFYTCLRSAPAFLDKLPNRACRYRAMFTYHLCALKT